MEEIKNTEATTAYGFDRMVTSLNKGNPGYRTGATSRSGGRTHLANSSDKHTACGITVNASYALIVPRHGLTGEEWVDRQVTCSKCRKAAGVK